MQNIFSLQNPWRIQSDWRLVGLTPRRIQPSILNWIDEPEIIVIRGARQVGKTTLVQQIIYDLIHKAKVHPENIFYFSFDDRDLRNLVLQNPKSVFSFIRQQRKRIDKDKVFVFFDEIQKAPPILEILKIYYDSDKYFKFIITGSSSLELSKGVSESLLGRVVNFHLHSLTFQETLTLKGSKTSAKFLPEAGSEVEKFLQNFANYQRLEKIFSELNFYKDEIILQFNEYLLRGGYPGVAKKERLKAEMVLIEVKYQNFVKEKIPTVMKNFMKANGKRCQKGLVVTKDFMGKKSCDFGEIYFIPLSLLALGV